MLLNLFTGERMVLNLCHICL